MPKTTSYTFEDLDEFLMSDGSPDNCMQLSDLDGFLTAIVVGPEPIPPSEWLPVIWGDEQPSFDDPEQAELVIGAIMARYTEILAGLQHNPPVVEPVFWVRDGLPIVADWAEGFMDGVKLRLTKWSQLIASDDNTILIPLAAYWTDDDDHPIIDIDEEVRERINDDAPELIPQAVAAIYRYWRLHTLYRTPGGQADGEDPCPCGSGRKYRKCCGLN